MLHFNHSKIWASIKGALSIRPSAVVHSNNSTKHSNRQRHCAWVLIPILKMNGRLTGGRLNSSLSVCALATAIAVVPISAQAESWQVNLQDADIKAFINEVANITNKNFVLDPRINGTVTVISNRALSKEEIYQLFLTVMQVNGVAAIDTGTTIKLVPDNVAKQSGIAVDLTGETQGEGLNTRVVYLQNISANEVLTVVRPLMPQSAHAAVVPGINALVLSDRADSLNQITTLIDSLDSPNNEAFGIIPLRHVDAERMMGMINDLLDTAAPSAGNTVTKQLKVIADDSSDRLLVQGSPEMIAKVQTMVNQLDTMPSKRLSGLRVFRLKYASAAHVADMLRGLLSEQSLNSSGAVSTLESASLDSAASQGATLGESSGIGSQPRTSAAQNLTSRTSSSSSGNTRGFSIIADETQNSIMVNGDPSLMAEVEEVLQQLDVRRPQVLIQAAIIEVSGNDAKQLGVQWALGNANSGYGVVNFNNVGVSATTLASAILSGGATGSSAASSIAGAFLGIGDSRKDSNGNTEFYGAILQALESTTSANLLSMPSILTLDNEKASILVGQNVPFVTGSYTTATNANTSPFQTIERQDVGINLNVIPHVGADGTVRLEVSQEVSSVVNGTTNNANGLITNKNLINTTILADNQQTIALGGLMRDDSTTRDQKVPILGDVPVIGRLFRSDNVSTEKRNLIIFLQPTILRDSGAVASVTEQRYNQIQTMQLVIDANGTIKKVPLSDLGGSMNQNLANQNYINQNAYNQNPVNQNPINQNPTSWDNHSASLGAQSDPVLPTNYSPAPLSPISQQNESAIQITGLQSTANPSSTSNNSASSNQLFLKERTNSVNNGSNDSAIINRVLNDKAIAWGQQNKYIDLTQ